MERQRGKACAMRVCDGFAGGTEKSGIFRNSGLSPSPPLKGGEKGKSSPEKTLDGKPAVDRKAEWLRENLPMVAEGVDRFASAFGRSNLTVVYASENGHVIGRPGPDGVRLSETVVGSLKPDGSAKKAR